MMRNNLLAEQQTAMRGGLVFALALFFVLLPVGAGPQGAAEGSGLRQFVLVLLFMSATFTIARFPERLRLVARALPLGLLALLVYALMSSLWSPERYVSFKRVVQLIGVALLGLALVAGGDGRPRLLRLAEPVLWLGMLLAIIVGAAVRDFAFAENGFRAFMATKNNFGQFAALCVLVPIALLHVDAGRRRGARLLLAALGLAGLVLSRSVTAGVALGVVAVVYLAFRALRGLHRSWWMVLLVVAIAFLTLLFATGVVLGFPQHVFSVLVHARRLVHHDVRHGAVTLQRRRTRRLRGAGCARSTNGGGDECEDGFLHGCGFVGWI